MDEKYSVRWPKLKRDNLLRCSEWTINRLAMGEIQADHSRALMYCLGELSRLYKEMPEEDRDDVLEKLVEERWSDED
jgi:hypothetical protein